ncbi:hypothetical protein CYMTET_26420, partial [Cymbomonas tetramitiformis]
NSYQAQIWLMERISRSKFYTSDPEKADYFLLPFWDLAMTGSGSLGVNAIHNNIQYIREHWPYWDRYNGGKHMVILPDDQGACDLGTSLPQLANTTFIQINGLKVNNGRSRGVTNPCYVPKKDLIIPPPFGHRLGPTHELVNRPFKKIAENSTGQTRDKLLFFAGTVALPGMAAYSGGTRDLVVSHYLNDSMFHLVDIKKKPMSFEDYALGYLSAKFCLAPSGLGWGIRTFLAIFYECIPVIIQENVEMPYEEYLEWSAFSIRLENKDVPSLKEKLMGISSSKYEEYQTSLKCVWSRFQWTSIFGAFRSEAEHLERPDAFSTMMEILSRRARGGEVEKVDSCTKQPALDPLPSDLCEFPCAPGIPSPLQTVPEYMPP